MARFKRSLLFLSLTGFLLTISSQALSDEDRCYGEKVGGKTLSAFANLTTAWLEIPKNIINQTNNSNIVYGVVGGTLQGILNTVGRLSVGVTDLVTAPIPTEPIAYPVYIWDDFDVDTTYGEAFRLQD